MTTLYPPFVTWPAMACVAAVLIVRYRRFNKTGYESAYNNLLAFLLVANILREHAVEVQLEEAGIMSVTAAQQASLVAVVFANAELLRFIRLWTHPPAVAKRYSYFTPYIAAAAVSLAFWLAATPARDAGQTLEDFGGRTAVVSWTLLVSIFVVTGAGLAHNSALELRRPGAGTREHLLAISGMVVGGFIFITSIDVPLLVAAETLGWIEVAPQLSWLHGQTIFLETMGTLLFGMVPIATAVLARFGLDATNARFCRIRPLLIDVMGAAPEVIFQLPDPHRRCGWTALDLHQAVVQIRDGLLQLRPWMPPADDGGVVDLCERHRVPDSERAEATLAFQLAAAIQRKSSRLSPAPPAAVGSRAPYLPSRTADLDGEIAEMLRVAKWWSIARTSQPLEERHARKT